MKRTISLAASARLCIPYVGYDAAVPRFVCTRPCLCPYSVLYMPQKRGHRFRVTRKRWKHSTRNGNAKLFAYTGRSILQTQHAPAYHLFTDLIRRRRLSVFGRIAQRTQGLLYMTPFTVKSLCHPVVYLVGTGDVELVDLVLHEVDQVDVSSPDQVKSCLLDRPASSRYWFRPCRSWRQAVLRGDGGATQQPELAYAMTIINVNSSFSRERRVDIDDRFTPDTHDNEWLGGITVRV